MNRDSLNKLLEQVAEGKVDSQAALERLAQLPFEELSHSTLDLHRELRQGTPEVVYGQNKSIDQIRDNLLRIHQAHGKALATRVSRGKARRILAEDENGDFDYLDSARCLSLGLPPALHDTNKPYIAIVTAGTSDLAISNEAAATLQYLEHPFVQITDIGVAGIHRILPHLETLRHATAVIAIAGMEGALPSVLGGLLSCPIVAVPTSIGYGTAKNGETALHAMLTSCASGISVVNIDNGFGAALFTHTILQQVRLHSPAEDGA